MKLLKRRSKYEIVVVAACIIYNIARSLSLTNFFLIHIASNREPEPVPPNRVEFLPILWYDRVHSASNDMTRSLKGV